MVAFVYVEIDFANSFANRILESKSPMFWGVLKKFGFLRKIQNPHDYWGYFVQWVHSVNLLASPSVVRIHHPPPSPETVATPMVSGFFFTQLTEHEKAWWDTKKHRFWWQIDGSKHGQRGGHKALPDFLPRGGVHRCFQGPWQRSSAWHHLHQGSRCFHGCSFKKLWPSGKADLPLQ